MGAGQVNGTPVQTPPVQASVCEHAFPSLQVVPSAFWTTEHDPVCGSQEPASWHWSAVAHATGFEPAQVPDMQASVRVQAFPSSHGVASAFGGFEQFPVCGLHCPAMWHWSLAGHAFGLAPVQTPAWHVSVAVQALLSSHALPSAFGGFVHVPVCASHCPASWHWSSAWHTTGPPPVHTPAWQASVFVHAFPSSHGVPPAFAGEEHAPVCGSHCPAAWHWSSGWHRTGTPMQFPAWQPS